MNDSFFQRKTFWGAPNALLLLMIVFFLVPFAVRGARMALQKTENNVKDWLPAEFRETAELKWFGDHFISEQFIVATWDGCTEDSQRLKMFVAKLQAEMAPKATEGEELDEIALARQTLHDYVLFVDNSNYHCNWGGLNEKWLVDESGKHYYITPNGRLYRWEGGSNVVSALGRTFQRAVGSFRLEGQFVAGFGKPTTSQQANQFWQDPRLIATPLFKTVQTGPQVVQQLAGANRSLHVESNPVAGERMAVARLTGTLFGPPVPFDFGWSSQDVAKILPQEKLRQMPEGWEELWTRVVQKAADDHYQGDLQLLRRADPVDQAQVWYDFFDQVGVSEPPRQTCVMMTLTQPARRNLARVVGRGVLGKPTGRIFELAEECGVASPPKPVMAPPPFNLLVSQPLVAEPVLRVGGPPVDNVAIDEEGTITLVRLVGYSLAMGVFLSYLLLRSIRLMIMVFFVGGVSAMASMSVVWWSGQSVDAILLTMPSLVYVLGISGAIHVINYYRDAALVHGVSTAADRALRHALVPATLCAMTTAIGMGSLGLSNIMPIRKFGIFSAIGVVGTLFLVFVFLPSALAMFPPKMSQLQGAGARITKKIASFWETIGRFLVKRHWYVNAGMAAVMVFMAFGLFKIQTSVQLLKLFDPDSQIIQDYGWLEDNFGRLVPMELVVRFPESLQAPTGKSNELSEEQVRQARTQLTLLERAEAVKRIQDTLQARFGYSGENVVGRGMSAVTFLRDLPEPSYTYSPARSGANNLLLSKRDELLESEYLALEDSEHSKNAELWRISLRLGALNDVDYGQFVGSLRSAVEPIAAAYRCRKAVLDSVVAHGGDQLKGRVIILGRGRPPLTQSHESSDGDSNGVITKPSASNDDSLVLAETLRSCLINNTIQKVEWHDPVKNPLTEGRATSEKWARYLSEFDCVVLLENHSEYDVDFIQSNATSFVDASSMLAEIREMSRGAREDDGSPVEVSAHPGEMDVVYTGIIPVVYKAQRTLLISLVESVASAFVLIFGVMACLLSPAANFWGVFKPVNMLQGLASAAVSMIPNVFPVVVIFGFMGHAGTLVDIGTMMTASVALGVAVDDTIHFLSWFRGCIRRGMNRTEAIFDTYRNMAPAMTQTTIVGGLGLSVFALSTFTPTQRFGVLMLTLLFAALAGDLIWLPALLASPLGRFFCPRKNDLPNRNFDPSPQSSGLHDGTVSMGSDVSAVESKTSMGQTDSGETGGKTASGTTASIPAPKFSKSQRARKRS